MATGRRMILAALAAGYLCATGGGSAAEEKGFFPKDRVRPGMMGVGRTVFQGYQAEEFQVEILGILTNAIGPGQDMILSRLHGKNVERTGVIAGMSGSPVMLEGKLLGAVSYRMGQFEKEAIAGITPIEDMVRAAEMPPAEAGGQALLEEWRRGGAGGDRTAGRRGAGAVGDLLPIGTPLVFAGFPESVIREVAPIFQARGLEPVQGGGGSGRGGEEYPIEPGAAIAVPLVRGDLSVAATGTLTYVDGKRVWGFGHPFLGVGGVRLPMSRAEIVVTYPSAIGSFKISNATSLIGTLLQDRLTAIEGELGESPPMLPVSVDLDTPTGAKRLRFEVARDRALTPLLVGITVQASLQRVVEFSAESTLRADVRIEFEDHPPIRYASVSSDLGGPQAAGAADLARELASLFNLIAANRFEAARIRSAALAVSMVPKARLARVGEVTYSPATIRPGDEITVTATVEPFRGPAAVREFRVRVPSDTPRGPVYLIVSSARSLDQFEANLLQQRLAGGADLDALVRLVNSLRSDDRLYVQLSRRGLGAVVQGEVMPALPLSVLFTLGSNRYSGEEYPLPELPIFETAEKTDYVLVGGKRTALTVR